MTEASFFEQPATFVIDTPQPFSFPETLRYLGRSANEPLYHILEDKVRRWIPCGDEAILVEISCPNPSELHVVCLGRQMEVSAAQQAALTAYIRDWFDLDTDLQPFYRIADGCPLLRDAAEAYFGLRVIGVPDLFEAISWAIMGQQINLAFAYTLKRRFVETFGTHCEWGGQRFWRFPAPCAISQVTVQDLMGLQFTRRKAEYLIGIAEELESGRLSKHGLLSCGNFGEAERALVALRGIGHWSANYVLMRCLRDPSAFPIEDVGLQNAVKVKLGWDRKPTLAELRQFAERWRGYEAYATFYLWRSLYGGGV